MSILILLLGATLLGGFLLSDNETSQEAETDDFSEEDSDILETSESANPLSLDIITGWDSTSAIEASTVEQSSAVDLYDGLTDEEIGSTDKSFGIAHRYYENDPINEMLKGSGDDETLYIGAGSFASGGDGSDVFDIFLPDALVGAEVAEITDFDALEDTLIVRFEADALVGPQSFDLLPNASLSYSDGLSVLSVNGIEVAHLNSQSNDLEIAISTDGNGEDFVTTAGDPIAGNDLKDYQVHLIWMSEQVLYGF